MAAYLQTAGGGMMEIDEQKTLAAIRNPRRRLTTASKWLPRVIRNSLLAIDCALFCALICALFCALFCAFICALFCALLCGFFTTFISESFHAQFTFQSCKLLCISHHSSRQSLSPTSSRKGLRISPISSAKIVSRLSQLFRFYDQAPLTTHPRKL